jgi:hypothetical protein
MSDKRDKSGAPEPLIMGITINNAILRGERTARVATFTKPLLRLDFVLADAIEYSDYEKYDTTFIAAMIESKKVSKEEFINSLAKKVKKHTHILVRSVFHNRELLYKKLNVNKIVGLQPILEVRPKNQIVNSFHVFEK